MSSSLRILHVSPYYEQAWAYGGIPRLATAMTHGLARRGHAVTVCTTDACDERSRAAVSQAPGGPSNLDVRVFPNLSNRLAYHWQFFTPVGFRTHLARHARGFDIAHIHACRNLPGSFAARALYKAGIPYVISPNGTAPSIERRFFAKRVFDATAGRHVLERAARLVATTNAERKQLRDMGYGDDSIATVPNPIDERDLHVSPDGARFRHAHHLRGPVILFLGKLTPRKSVDVLVRAFARVQTPAATLVIAGNDMGAGPTIDTAVDATGLRPRVRRIGLLRNGDRFDALAAADVVVYPGRDEIFGLVAIEALLCGTPVVVASDSGCGETVGTIGGGHIVPHGDEASLAGAVDSILQSPSLWRARARAAGVRARERFSSSAVCAQLERLYETILREPSSVRPS